MNHKDLIAAAREWIDDVTDEVPPGISDEGIVLLINKNYEGGWKQFAQDQS